MPRRIYLGMYDTDKVRNPSIYKNFIEFFKPISDRKIKLLELGVYKSGSVLLWRDFFPYGTIIGLDVNPKKPNDSSGMIHILQGEQEDINLLDKS
jgi:hypothetical protein